MKSRKKKILSVCVLLLLLCFLFESSLLELGTGRTGNGENGKHVVAVITKSTASAYFKSAFAGANAAGTEYNLDITFDAPEDEEDYETQNEMIAQAVREGAEVIVLSAVDYNATAEAVERAAAAGVKVVIIDSDVNSAKVSCRISTDNYQAGRMVGEAVLDSDEQAIYVGIVNFDKNSANGQQREEGFRDAVRKDSRVTIIDAINVISHVTEARRDTKLMLRQHPGINAIVTFNEWTSLGVGYAVHDLGLADETNVIAFDSNVVSVGMLETGEVDALIVQNPYAMGYLGIECAYNLINGNQPESAEIDTTTTVVTKENMFDDSCQRVLFAFDDEMEENTQK